MALHYLNQKYQPGLVFQQLEKIDYRMVVGIDVGHGECMAYVYRKDSSGDWEPEALHVNSDYEKKIPSYIAYDDNGEPIIGKSVSRVSGKFHVYFKQEPSKWDEKPDDDAPTYKQLMQDYISVLWNNIWTQNDIFKDRVNSITKDDILVVIGCPASGSWTKPEAMREYVELTKEATGCSKVMILAESTAAIMTPIYLQQVVELGNGVAIYDFGSSTLDFTYILMGKVLLTASIPLGGSDVDRAMLRYILSKKQIDERKIELQCKNKCYTELRSEKENYYDTHQLGLDEREIKIVQTLHYRLDDKTLGNVLDEMQLAYNETTLKEVIRNADENLVNKTMLDLILKTHKLEDLSDEKRKEILKENYKKLSAARADYLGFEEQKQYSISVTDKIPYAVNKDMMEFVITKDTAVSMNKLDAGYRDKSWKDCVEQFFENTKNSIGTNPCSTVILTGGTSRITDVHEIARAKYGNQVTIHAETDPSSTVAKGLCLAKGHEVSAVEKIDALKAELHENAKRYFADLCSGFGKGTLFDCVWAKMTLTISALESECNEAIKRGETGITTYRHFKEALEQKMSNDTVFLNNVQTKFSEYMIKYMDPSLWKDSKKPHYTELAREKANKLASDIYGTQATTVPQVSGDMINSLAGEIDNTVLRAVVRETSLARAAQKIVVDYMDDGKKSLTGRLKKMVKKIGLHFDSKITPADIGNMHTAMLLADKEKYRKDLGFDFGWGLQHSDAFKGIFESLIDQQFEVAIGIILFQVFDH